MGYIKIEINCAGSRQSGQIQKQHRGLLSLEQEILGVIKEQCCLFSFFPFPLFLVSYLYAKTQHVIIHFFLLIVFNSFKNRLPKVF